MDNKELKVFELRWTEQGEKEWVCAYTNLHAIQTYLWVTSTNVMDFDTSDEIVEVPKERWSEMRIKNIEYDPSDPEDKEFETFEEYMKTKATPDIIAGTMYE
jgi:hypothetical protein